MALAARSSEESVREQRPVPPASKEAIARLPLFTWDEAKQQEQSVCSICTEVLQVGDQVQSLPCHKTHLFHPACLHPWLSKSNACPVCREELPTDDLDYEAEKERKAEQEKERRGAQNALGHNEFMYM
ncbi:hypothetical protein DUNSADRAFT_13802 [Dunaliella salina]|uniref:RING-type domain-containing protein n=1 Tax=Dunaliella salina TaxID=3046 RepID=A0ABQ7G8L9_DUNSA|nr:hypothetical protein DUNSADRAFT_13802 [Dunaliella salina]|eukprot:KAF5830946.1 hypothetical protein DUNSADRAFT_13802 [Dunaliella salina]